MNTRSSILCDPLWPSVVNALRPLILIVVGVMMGCAPASDRPTPVSAPADLAGTMVANRYLAPTGGWSIAAPEPFGGDGPVAVEDEIGEGAGRVVFSDDAGLLTRVDAVALPDDFEARLQSGSIAEALQQAQATILESYREVSPELRSLHQEFLPLPNVSGADFFVVDMPGGSNLRDADGERQDALRGTLCFIHDGSLFTLSALAPPDAGRGWRDIEALRERLIQSFMTMRFE